MKYVFIDMDNTIAENQTCENIEFYRGMYLNKRPIRIVIDAIKKLYPESKYIIISKTNGEWDGRLEKKIWLDEYFPEAGLVFLLTPKENKKDYIELYMVSQNAKACDCLLIDDKKEELQKVKKLGVNVKYPQQLICDYEDYKSKL